MSQYILDPNGLEYSINIELGSNGNTWLEVDGPLIRQLNYGIEAYKALS